jgi:hypothetical protein
MVPYDIGAYAQGLARHRALLFKALAGPLDIPCRLVRGAYYCGDEVTAGVVLVPPRGAELHVDLMANPGKLTAAAALNAAAAAEEAKAAAATEAAAAVHSATAAIGGESGAGAGAGAGAGLEDPPPQSYAPATAPAPAPAPAPSAPPQPMPDDEFETAVYSLTLAHEGISNEFAAEAFLCCGGDLRRANLVGPCYDKALQTT